MLTKADIEEMTVDERVELAIALWNSVHDEVGAVPLHDWQEKILKERLAYSLAHPTAAQPWREVMERIEDRVRNVRSSH
ncbi:MAG TPA: addiction module protein [Candidatus Kapabacteria bacterium]|nr:addiction module protein [Candidatus Kapabacteria bacterium]